MSVPSTPPTYAEVVALNDTLKQRNADLHADQTMLMDAVKEFHRQTAYLILSIEGEPLDQPVPYTPVTPITPISRKGA